MYRVFILGKISTRVLGRLDVALALAIIPLTAVLALASLTPQEAFAVDYIISDQASCESLPGGSPEWIGATSTCQIDDLLTLPAGDTVNIDPGITLEIMATGEIDSAIAFTVTGDITNAGTITNTGTLTINGNMENSGTITNSGDLTNTGTFENDGTLEIDCDGEINGSITGSVVDTCPDEDDGRRSRGEGGHVIINSQDGTSVTVHPESYFAEHPLERIQVSNSSLLDAAGAGTSQAGIGQQLSVRATFANQQETEQDYALIVQITDERGFIVFIGWQQGAVESGQAVAVSTAWTPEQEGRCIIQIFVWDGVDASPTPLSRVTVDSISVTE